MYPEIDKGLKDGLKRTVQFTGLFTVNVVSADETDANNFIRVYYKERLYSPVNNKLLFEQETHYEEKFESVVRWIAKTIPGTSIEVGNDVIIPSINIHLEEILP